MKKRKKALHELVVEPHSKFHHRVGGRYKMGKAAKLAVLIFDVFSC